MIKRTPYMLPPQGENPALVGMDFAEAPCGCRVFSGFRLDTKEPALGCVPCEDSHQELMTRFDLTMKESLVEPTSRPLIEVVDEMLMNLHADDQARAS
jgi:hypothetical protein